MVVVVVAVLEVVLVVVLVVVVVVVAVAADVAVEFPEDEGTIRDCNTCTYRDGIRIANRALVNIRPYSQRAWRFCRGHSVNA